MNSFTTQCPHCHQMLQAESSLAGATVSCPSCNKTFTVPRIVATGTANPVPTMVNPHAGRDPDYHDMWKSPVGWICAVAVIGGGLLIAQLDSDVAKTIAKISPILALGLFVLVTKKGK